MNRRAGMWQQMAWRSVVIALMASTVAVPSAAAQDGEVAPCGDVTVIAAEAGGGIDAAIAATNACPGPQTIFVETGLYTKSQPFETIRDDVMIVGDEFAPPTFTSTFTSPGTYSTLFVVRDGAVADFGHLIFTDIGSVATFVDTLDSTVHISNVVMNGSVPNQSESGGSAIVGRNSTISLTDTQILNPDSNGIIGRNGTHLIATNVVIDGAASTGVRVDSIQATNLRVLNSGNDGVQMTNGGTIDGSYFWANGGDGISHSTRAAEVIVTNTKVGIDPEGNPGPNGHGISGFGHFVLTNVVVANNIGSGVSVGGEGTIPSPFTDVVITNNGQGGFNGSGTVFAFVRVSITNNGGTGYYHPGQATTAVDSTITGNVVDCQYFGEPITDNGGNVDSDGTCGFVVPNDPPTPADDTAEATLSQLVTIDVLANDTDPDGDELTITSTTSPNAAVAADGLSISFDAPQDFAGETFTYEVADDQDERASALVTVTLVCPDITVAAADGGAGLVAAVALTEACPGAQTVWVEPGNYILDGGFVIADQLSIRAVDAGDRPKLVVRVPPSRTGFLFSVDAAVGPFELRDINIEATAPWAIALLRSTNANFEAVGFTPIGAPVGCAIGVPSALRFEASMATLAEIALNQPSCNGIDADVTSDITVTSSVITGAANNGIASAGVLRVHDSFLYGNSNDGIATTGGSLTVTDSVFGTYGSFGELIVAGNGGAGVRADATSVELNVVVAANNAVGLWAANNGANPTVIQGSTFFDNASSGIHVGPSTSVELTTTQLRTNGANCLLEAAASIVDGGDNTDDDGSCGTNHPPVATPDRTSMHEDTTLVIDAPGVLDNDRDIDGDVLTAELVSGPANASLFDLRPDGGVAYVPNANFFGNDEFTYRVTDGSAYSEPTQFSISVRGVNDAPEIVAPTELVVERNTTAPIQITVVDVDADDTPPFVNDSVVPLVGLGVDEGTLLVAPTAGVVITETPNGVIALEGELAALNAALATLTYTPPSDFLGEAVVSVVVEDRGENGSGGVLTDQAEIVIDVRNPNRAPVAQHEDYATNEDTLLSVVAPGVLGNDIEPDGDVMTASLVTAPEVGTLVLADDGSFTYAPPPDFFGEVFFRYQALDGQAGSNDVRVTITVDPVNDAPTITASPNPLVFDEDGQGVIDVIVGDVDDPLENINFSADLIDQTLASVVISGTGTTRTVTLTGAPDRAGSTTLLIGANDGQDGGPEFIPVTITPINDAPTLEPIGDTTIDEDEAGTVAIVVADVEITVEELTVTATTNPAGLVAVAANATNTALTLAPVADANGQTEVTVTVSDGDDESTTVFLLNITPVNDAPIGVADGYVTDENVEIKLDTRADGVLNNDTDVDGDLLTVESHTEPDHGMLTVLPDGTFSYEPDAEFFGADEFTYVATDGELATAEVTVTIVVQRDNAAPVAMLFIPARVEHPGDVTVDAAGTFDPDGDPLTYVWSDNVVSLGDSTATFAGPLDDGDHVISVEVCDNFGLCDTASDTLVITNRRPSIELDMSPAGVLIGEATLTATVEISDTGVLDTHTGTIDWGDGTVDDFVPTLESASDLSHTYVAVASEQRLFVTITVIDDDGGTAVITRSVILRPAPNEGPHAAFTSQTTLLSGRPAIFNATSSNDDAGIVEYRWQIGDGSIITTTDPIATLEIPTQLAAQVSRVISLTVVDADGLSDTTEQLRSIDHGGAIYTLRDKTVSEGDQTSIIVDYQQRPLEYTSAPPVAAPGQLQIFPGSPPCSLGGDLEFAFGQSVVNPNLPFSSPGAVAEVTACGDFTPDDGETFQVRLQSGSGPTSWMASATITIEDSPPFLGLVLDEPTVEVMEGDAVAIMWQVVTPPTAPIQLDVTSPLDSTGATMCSGSIDYLPSSPQGRPTKTVGVFPGSTVISVQFETCQDAELEDKELVIIELGAFGHVVGQAVVQILDDDADVELPVIGDAEVRLVEGETAELVFKVTSGPSQVFPVWLQPVDGDAIGGLACGGSFNVQQGTDWAGHLAGSSTPMSVELGEDQKLVSFPIQACDLGGVEANEEAVVQLMAGSIPLATAKIRIADFYSAFEVDAEPLFLVQGQSGSVEYTTTSAVEPLDLDEVVLWAEPVSGTLGHAGPSCFGNLTNPSGLTLDPAPDVFASTDIASCPGHVLDGPVTFDLVLRAEDDAGAATYDLGSALVTLRAATGCDGVVDLPTSECLALVEFYFATGGPDWFDDTNWLTDAHPCTWVGVACDAGHVVELAGDEVDALSLNNLTGYLPDGLDALTELRVLQLFGNSLSGGLPVSLATLGDLELLSLGGNQLSGPIPAEYAGLGSLVNVQLSHNQLQGPVPEYIGDPDVLERLTLNNNELSGTVPSTWREFDFANLRLDNQTGCLQADAETSAMLELLNPDWNDGCPDTEPPIIYGAFDMEALADIDSDQGVVDDFTVWAIDNVDGSVPVVCNPSEGVFTIGDHVITCKASDQVGNQATATFTLTLRNQTFCESRTDVPLLHCEALVKLYEETDGANWKSGDDGWFTPLAICKWDGVYCNGNTGNIYRLSMAGLHGEIPDELGDITTLESLTFRGEKPSNGPATDECEDDDAPAPPPPPPLRKLSGDIPESFGQLVALEELQLSDNLLSGSIPAGVMQLPELSDLLLDNNRLTDSIPAPATGTMLRDVDLQQNSLNGFDGEWPALGELVYFDASDNGLQNSPPSALFAAPKLKELHLQRNNLSGPLPDLVAGSALRRLDVSFNQFSGNLPQSLGLAWNLWHLDVQANRFNGLIPLSIGQTQPGLTIVSLARNELVGTIPTGLTSLEFLRSLDLSHNALIGPLPGGWSISELVLDVSDNQLSGALPDGMELSELRAGSNRFTSLPDTLRAHLLDVSGNQLSGPVPPLEVTIARLGSNDLTALPALWFDASSETDSPTQIHASNNQITSLPDAAGGNFLLIDLSGNPINGPLPVSWFGGFNTLTELKIQTSGLTGQLGGALVADIAAEYAQMTELDLSGNDLSGEIPWELVASMAGPTLIDCDEGPPGRLALAGNAFSGPVPDEVTEVVLRLRPQRGCLTASAATAAWLNLNQSGWDDACGPPTIDPMADITIFVGVSDPAPKVTWLTTATDPVDGVISPICLPGSGKLFPRGTTGVVCTATGSSGLSATIGFDVTVIDDDGSLPHDRLTNERGRPADEFIAGSRGAVSGSGFHQGLTVRAELRSTPVLLAESVADEFGRMTIEFTIPADTEPGEHHIVLVGVGPDGRAREVRFPITVLAALASSGGAVYQPVGDAPPRETAGEPASGLENAATIVNEPVETTLAYTGTMSTHLAMLAFALLAVGSMLGGLGRTRRVRSFRHSNVR